MTQQEKLEISRRIRSDFENGNNMDIDLLCSLLKIYYDILDGKADRGVIDGQ